MIYTPECFGEKKKQAVVITIWQRPASFFMCILFGINVWKCMRERCLKIEIDNCETRERRVGGVSQFSKK